MNKKGFIEAYVPVFLASFAAVSYIENCQKGWPDHTQPVEDAQCLAEEAWEQIEAAGLTDGR